MKKNRKQRVACINASRGIERKEALKKGVIWVRPTMTMSMKTNYKRNQQKAKDRQLIGEYTRRI